MDTGQLFGRLRSGHTLITANSRLARVLKHRYDHWRILEGDRQWPRPGIFSWRQWLDRFWESASLQGAPGSNRAVASDRQLASLWESVLKVEADGPLMRRAALARQLRDTRRRARDWGLSFDHAAWRDSGNENCSAFRRWNTAFEALCEKAGWCSPEDRPALLCKAIGHTPLLDRGNIDLLGFDEFTPAQASLLEALIGSGHALCGVSIMPRRGRAVLWRSRDSTDELQGMARWVRYWFEREPDSSIAIVVHDLAARRREVERLLQDILAPAADTRGHQDRPWNMSMGTPLAGEPMVAAAFDLLALLDEPVDIQLAGRVLRSPWIQGAATERNSRALLEKCLRDRYPRQLKLRELHFRAAEIRKRDHRGRELPEDQQQPQAWNSPQLAAIFGALGNFRRDHGGLRPASAWAGHFDQLLLGLGWPLAGASGSPGPPGAAPGEAGRDWQALQSFREALRELASLDTTTGDIGRAAAIGQLRQICREKIFQPKSGETRVQVLGHYEVSGLRFDHLWVLGLHGGNWPPAASPDPFIPAALQKAADMPASSPRRELQVASAVTERLLDTAPDCVFSYPERQGAETVLPSPLLDRADIEVVAEVPAWQGDNCMIAVSRAAKPRLQPLDSPGPTRYATTRGGSSILKHQALCPFRAFASNRLGAEGLETPADGISPALHGSLVHRVLEHFWSQTRDRAALLRLDPEALGERVGAHVEQVTAEDRGLQQRPAFRRVEARRVQRHVLAFLELEKQREDFEVAGLEQEVITRIAGQEVRLFIDRVDRLPSGAQVIIDYKTGRIEPGKWFGDRPEDPQLPLYAVSASEQPAAVVFGIVREDGCLYRGVAERAGLLPGLPPAASARTRYLVDAGERLGETIENWRQVLHRLMADFLAGEAAVDPKAGTGTCAKSYCKLQSLCRVGELEQRRSRQRLEPSA